MSGSKHEVEGDASDSRKRKRHSSQDVSSQTTLSPAQQSLNQAALFLQDSQKKYAQIKNSDKESLIQKRMATVEHVRQFVKQFSAANKIEAFVSKGAKQSRSDASLQHDWDDFEEVYAQCRACIIRPAGSSSSSSSSAESPSETQVQVLAEYLLFSIEQNAGDASDFERVLPVFLPAVPR